MTRHRLTRALIALAVPALLVPALATSATADPGPSATPTLAQVAEIYPHLDGGTADATHEKVYEPSKSCKDGDPIKGASSKTVTYSAPMDSPSDYEVTGAKPSVAVSVVRLPSTKVARDYLAVGRVETKKCTDDDPHSKLTVTTIPFRVDGQHWGYRFRWTTKGSITIVNALFARTGRTVVSVMSMSLEGRKAPSTPKTIDLMRLALRTL
ncbi:hypothetical protein ABLE68_12675 [Nocardioides sp. CN2-186]|uniref:hypothetical protein n=1 Tax=Nocardioides tweenelious TaxID=3156607 RepID=UPI0032B32876